MKLLDKLNTRVSHSLFGKYFRLEGSGHVSFFPSSYQRPAPGAHTCVAFGSARHSERAFP